MTVKAHECPSFTMTFFSTANPRSSALWPAERVRISFSPDDGVRISSDLDLRPNWYAVKGHKWGNSECAIESKVLLCLFSRSIYKVL